MRAAQIKAGGRYVWTGGGDPTTTRLPPSPWEVEALGEPAGGAVRVRVVPVLERELPSPSGWGSRRTEIGPEGETVIQTRELWGPWDADADAARAAREARVREVNAARHVLLTAGLLEEDDRQWTYAGGWGQWSGLVGGIRVAAYLMARETAGAP